MNNNNNNNAGCRVMELIRKKRDGQELNEFEMDAFVQGVATGKISMAQSAAMLMAMYLQKLNHKETVNLTRAMVDSGERFHWPQHWKGLMVDKHSTGGVGDKISIPLAPALAACGLKIPMISGRGLGYTGGTLDKLESIPGFNVSQSMEDIRRQLETVGACIVGQTQSLVPADKVLYSIRDTTATVDNLSLMTASIISKKAAEAVDALVLEVTYGSAAFLKTIEEAQQLAVMMTQLGDSLGILTSAMILRMDDPLGHMIGNTLEIIESIQCLNGQGPADLEYCVCQMGGQLLVDSGLADTVEAGANIIRGKLKDGSAKLKFADMMVAQGVDPAVASALIAEDADLTSILPSAKYTTDVTAPSTGYVHHIDALACGMLAHELGAGRQRPGEGINYTVGLHLHAHVGSSIRQGEVWATVHHDSEILTEEQEQCLAAALLVCDEPPSEETTKRIVQELR